MFELFLQQYIWFALIGVVVGVLSGLLGIGGGMVLVPVLSAIFIAGGWPHALAFHAALATSMACIVLTSLSSIRAHHLRGNIVWSYLWRMVPMAFLGSMLATLLVVRLNAVALTAFFAAFALYAAMHMLRDQPSAQPPASVVSPSDRVLQNVKVPGNTEVGLVSLGIGVISALVSIGGGTLTVPYLNMRHVEMKQAIGTSAVLGFPIAVASTLSYVWDGMHTTYGLPHSLGYLYGPAIVLITPLSVLMAPCGVALTARLPVKVLKRIFALFLLLVGMKLLWGVWHA